MPRHVITNATVSINGTALTARVKKVTIRTAKRPPANVNAMTDGWDENILVDIKSWKASFDLYQDYTTGSVWSVLKGVFDSTASSGVQIIVRPTTGTRSSDNPDWQGNVLLDGEFPQIDGEHGGINMQPVNFLGTGALSFLTSAT